MRSIIYSFIRSPLFIISWMMLLILAGTPHSIFASCSSTDSTKQIAVNILDSEGLRYGPVADACIPAARTGVNAAIAPDQLPLWGNEAQSIGWSCGGGDPTFAPGTFRVTSKRCSYYGTPSLLGAGGEMYFDLTSLPSGFACADITWEYGQVPVAPNPFVPLQTGSGSCNIRPILIESPTNRTMMNIRLNKPKGWMKLRDASFSKQSDLKINFPTSVTAYDFNDDGSNAFIIGKSGLISSSGTITLKPATTRYSTNNLVAQGGITPIKTYLSDLNSFSNPTVHNQNVNHINYLSALKLNAINYYEPPSVFSTSLDINNVAQLPSSASGPYVLIVQGDINFIPPAYDVITGGSIALIATGKISIDPSYTMINAILIADSFDLATGKTDTNPSTNPLKIYGNLISNTPIDLDKLPRNRTDNTKPSVFVVFTPNKYIDLLPYLSTIERKGTQIQ